MPVGVVRSLAWIAGAAVIFAGTAERGLGQAGPLCTVEKAKLTSGLFEEFGGATSIEGDTAAVGAYGADYKGTSSGACYVFVRNGSTWTQQGLLLASDGSVGDWLGFSVAISGDTIAAGSPHHDVGFGDAGAVYVYTRSGTIWTEQAELLRPGGQIPQGNFGYDVAVQGHRLLVGSPEIQAVTAGSVHLFERSGSTWTFKKKLVPNDGRPGHYFGARLALDGASALITAPGNSAAYVFVESTTWLQEAKLVASTGFPGDVFGSSASLSLDRALVGAVGAGAAYVFERSGSIWTETKELLASDGTPQDNFGRSVALRGDVAVVGAFTKSDPEAASGAAYVFARSGGSWTEVTKLVPGDLSAHDELGTSVAYDGQSILVGAGFESGGKGAAYVFLPGGLGAVYCTAKANSCGTLPTIGWTGEPSASATSGFVVHAQNAKAGKAGLLLYTDAGRGNAPFAGGILCLATNPLKRTLAVFDTVGTPGQCDGVLAFDMNAFAAGALGGNPLASLAIPGTQVNCQFWGRDTLGNALLSNALEYFVCE